MTEPFVHFLWQFQYFDTTQLITTEGEPIRVLKIGKSNKNSGPDFAECRVVIGDVEWAGTVEIHTNSSDWYAHRHQQDLAYENVILHVVWQHNRDVFRQDGSKIPTLELANRTNYRLLSKYQNILAHKSEITCQSQWNSVAEITKIAMFDRIQAERLEQKSEKVTELLHHNNYDWEETTYQLLAQNYGFKINAEPFLAVARALPFKILLKYRQQLFQLEALLLGIAGFLEEPPVDEYHGLLKKEYNFLRIKHQLDTLDKHQWKFMRLRPANFPTLRLAQLAALVHNESQLFSMLLNTHDLKILLPYFQAKPSLYWQTHYSFCKLSEKSPSTMGKSSVENIVINTLVPLLVTYAQQKDERKFFEKAVCLLEQLPAEDNRIIRLWNEMGTKSRHAFDSQALIQLYGQYCSTKNCLNCMIGLALLKN